MAHWTVRGLIVGTSRRPDTLGQRRSACRFTLTSHGDGRTVVRTVDELAIPRPAILRDVTAAYGADGAFVDASVRVEVAGAPMMACALRRDGDALALDAHGPSFGHMTQRLAWPGHVRDVLLHPIFNDGHLLRHVDPVGGPRRETVELFAISTDHRGATPPPARAIRIGIEYVGREEAEVAAGRFACHHYRYVDDGASGLDARSPDIDVWVTDGFVYVRGAIGPPALAAFELVEYAAE